MIKLQQVFYQSYPKHWIFLSANPNRYVYATITTCFKAVERSSPWEIILKLCLGNASTYANRWMHVQNPRYGQGLWNYVRLWSSRSKQIRASDGLTTPGWRMMNYPVQNPHSTMIISVMYMLSLCHKNMYPVQSVETRLCSWSLVHVNTTG